MLAPSCYRTAGTLGVNGFGLGFFRVNLGYNFLIYELLLVGKSYRFEGRYLASCHDQCLPNYGLGLMEFLNNLK